MTAAARSAAEERLLDAALTQVMAGEVAARRRTAWSRHGYFAAAALAVVAVVGTSWLTGTDGPVPAAQDPLPEPLPRPILVRDVSDLAGLPADVQNLVCELRRPADLEPLRRFTALRRLELRNEPPPAGGAGPAGPQFWRDPRPEALAPLAALPELRELQWPRTMLVQGKHLAALAKAPKLESLVLPERTPCGDDLAPALADLTHLQSLRFEFVVLPAPLFAGLAKLPLRRLAFLGCAGLDDDAFGALKAMQSLTALAITNQDGGTLVVDGVGHATTRLTAAAFSAMAAMPELHDLDLQESTFPDELLQQLPPGLQRLNLAGRTVDLAVATGLHRITQLKDLTVGFGNDTKAAQRMVEELGRLRLVRFDYRGVPTVELLRAAAAQPELLDLTIQLFDVVDVVDLTPLAAAPRLRSLEVLGTYRPATKADEFAPLAQCKPLRHLRLVGCPLDAGSVSAVVGKDVAVEVVATR